MDYDTDYNPSFDNELLMDQQVVRQAQLLERIGVGTVARVYKAKASNGQIVAIKISYFADEEGIECLTPSEQEEVKQFVLMEPRIHRKLQHANIPRMYDYYVSERAVIMHMEYFEGEDLWSYLSRNDDIEAKEVRTILEELYSTLTYIHRKNVSHCDIHKGNILIDENCNVKLVDFGSAAAGAQAGEMKIFDFDRVNDIRDDLLGSSSLR